MGEIISHDFGKSDREHARRLADLLNLLKDREEELLANPGKYFALASERLSEQQKLLHALSDAVKLPMTACFCSDPPAVALPDVVRVDRRDYEALQAVRALIREWDRRR